MAQQPFINHVSIPSAEFGATVEISGGNFSGSPRVFFGGVEATVTYNSNNLIQVAVPAGAPNASIFVLNNEKIAQSSERFYLSFGGSDTTATFDTTYTQSTNQRAASDLCLCDLNGDHKQDIIVVHRHTDQSGEEATIFINNIDTTGKLPDTSFEGKSLDIEENQSGFFSVVCADLDNDGDNDLAFSSNSGSGNDVFVLNNNDGNGNFSDNPDPLELKLPDSRTSDGNS
ncbi:MAG: FG-GAP-like repeat-containing protein, partial [Bacteroidota bacterium]